MNRTNSDLLTRYLTRADEAAFETLLERYLPPVRGVLWRRMGKSDAVDDLAMQTFAALARNAEKLRERDTLGAGWQSSGRETDWAIRGLLRNLEYIDPGAGFQWSRAVSNDDRRKPRWRLSPN